MQDWHVERAARRVSNGRCSSVTIPFSPASPFPRIMDGCFSFFTRIFAIGRCICCPNPIGDGMKRLGERFNKLHLDSLQEGKERERMG